MVGLPLLVVRLLLLGGLVVFFGISHYSAGRGHNLHFSKASCNSQQPRHHLLELLAEAIVPSCFTPQQSHLAQDCCKCAMPEPVWTGCEQNRQKFICLNFKDIRAPHTFDFHQVFATTCCACWEVFYWLVHTSSLLNACGHLQIQCIWLGA